MWQVVDCAISLAGAGRYRGRMREGSPDNLSQLVAATLQKGFPLLRFPAPLEARYRQATAGRRLRVLTLGVMFCFPLYLLLFIADHEMLPGSMDLAIKFRLGLFLPLVAMCAMALYRIQSPTLREWLIAGLGWTACLFSALIALSSQSAMSMQHLATLNPIVIYVALLGRFWPMLAMCWGVSGIYIVSSLFMGRLFSDIGVGNGLLLQANITFMLYGCYLLERLSRQSFLIDQQEGEMDAQLHEATDQLARIAQEDALTGLANRRRFTDYLQQAHWQAGQEGKPMALLMIDVDHFKAYNDRYGRPAGDECLKAIGQVLTAVVSRKDGLVARWGGEEFAIILAGTNAMRAMDVAEQLLEAVRARGIIHEASQVDRVVTLSIGMAVCSPGHDISQAGLLARADEALYHSKTSGRNKATMSDALAVQEGRESGSRRMESAT